MSKIFKLASSLLGIVAFFMMFVPQVIVNWASYPSESLGVAALTGGTSTYGVEFAGVGSGLAGYILVIIATVLILATAFLGFFKEHEVLDYIVLGIALILLLIGIILIFLIRKNFEGANPGLDPYSVSMGAGMIIAGIASIISLLAAGIALVMDIAQ